MLEGPISTNKYNYVRGRPCRRVVEVKIAIFWQMIFLKIVHTKLFPYNFFQIFELKDGRIRGKYTVVEIL